MEVKSGEAVALLGRNGVGKTTLLRTIAGLHQTKQGTSTSTTKTSPLTAHDRARRGIALVPQGRGIFPHLTVEENLTLGVSSLTGRERRPIRDRLRDGIVSGAGAWQRQRRSAERGEQQQLAIGRALVAQPTLLLLDEPTEGIQPSIVQEIGNALTRIRKELDCGHSGRAVSALRVVDYRPLLRDAARQDRAQRQYQDESARRRHSSTKHLSRADASCG